MSLAVVIVNYGTADYTLQCIDALAMERAALPGLRVVVVDGHSPDDSAVRLAAGIEAAGRGDWVTLLPLGVNGGFGFANNHGIAELLRGGEAPETIALVNPDARPRPGALAAMAAVLRREPRAAAVGALLIHADGRPQPSAFRFPSLLREFCRGARTRVVERLLRVPPVAIELSEAGEVPWVTGAAVMFRTEALRACGLFDEGFFLYFEETELMWRLRRGGWTIWHEPAARVEHVGSVATQVYDPATGQLRIQRTPRFWYESRRRYFALAHGRAYALLSGLAWLAGRGWWRLRQLVVRRPEDGALRSVGDMIEFGLWPTRRDTDGAAVRLDAPPSARPRWMAVR